MDANQKLRVLYMVQVLSKWQYLFLQCSEAGAFGTGFLERRN
jgi:hypothetical protein